MRNMISAPMAVVASLAMTITVASTETASTQTESAQTAPAQTVAPGDWPHFNRDAGSSRYVPLNQINSTNVGTLQPAWTFTPAPPPAAPDAGARGAGAAGRGGGGAGGRGGGRGGRGGGGAAVGGQAVPVVVNGVMYVPAGSMVVAIDGATGKEVWRYALTGGTASNRGVNYWPGNGTVRPRIVFTSGSNLIALDAATGQPAAGFGKNGIADMGVRWSGVPVVFRSVLAVGASTL
jgi:quinoprotein glucose dehydrogenase